MLKRLALLTCLLTTAAFAAEKVSLKQQFQPGTYWITNLSKTDQTMNMGPQAMKQAVTQMMVMKLDVGNADAQGNRKAALSYERIVQNMDMMNGQMTMNFDSDKPDNSSPLAAAMKPLSQATFTMTIDKDDNVTDVTGFSELLGEMQKTNPQAAQMLGQMKDAFGDEQIKQMISQGTQGLPAKQVTVGETWQQKIDMPLPMIGKMALNVDYKLTDVIQHNDRKLATVTFEGKGDLKDAAATAKQPLQFSRMDIKQDGRMYFDVAKGRAVRTELNQTTEMAAQAAGGEQGIAMDISQDMQAVILETAERNTEAEKEFLATGELPTME
ncbi:MAG: hypothetical protein GVY16_08835 [Planctomycetes bacterium]|jgi:hypothetical protein|nr:hypothetical protein [Phycisphaerae bacterium]NBB95833.1 hypothetical protein [Planctomycetota bacterium]